ncbi:MAG: FAD:protein FMN transferase [Verrucomicrobiota bacterium]
MEPAIDAMPAAHVHEWEAMKTIFRLHIVGTDAATARDAARDCFERLEYLETKLSRFVEGGDIWRLNRMQAGDVLHISDPCHRCLLMAFDGYEKTGGLFDVTLGRAITHIKDEVPGKPTVKSGRLHVDPEHATVVCKAAGLEIDFGGIGKGFALDELKTTLVEWEVPGALLCAGASSLLAYGPNAWPVQLAAEKNRLRLDLHNAALSASGSGQQGEHIVHPADFGPAERPRAWALAATAARAEIWSTAAMLMTAEDLQYLAPKEPELTAIYAETAGAVERVF